MERLRIFMCLWFWQKSCTVVSEKGTVDSSEDKKNMNFTSFIANKKSVERNVADFVNRSWVDTSTELKNLK